MGQNSAIQTKIISALHSSAIGGHSGTQATYYRVKGLFYWKGLKQSVVDFVQQCGIFQQAKHSNHHPAGLLQPLPIPEGAWQDISMDFIEGLPKSEGFIVILVVVDRFTRYAHFIPLKHPYTAKSVAQVIFDNVVKLHGLPKSIVSDRDKVFASVFWQELFKLMGTRLMLSSAYHPQTDGQTERVNQCLEIYLRCVVGEEPKSWKAWLAQAELWYNTSFHTALGCSPFYALYGHQPNLGTLSAEQQSSSSVSETVEHLQTQRELLKEHLARALNRMKLMADKKRSDKEFMVGDMVLLKLQPYAQSSVVNRPYPKLAFKYFGPYKMLARVGKAAYRLELPETSRIHPVFHVSQLKPFNADYTPVFAELPKVVDLGTGNLQPTEVLNRRLVKKGGKAVPQALIRWGDLPSETATWEDWYVIKERYPDAIAWGQAMSPAGGDVMTA